jgi:23S rRNA (pseudouridine1915-N3)-methyltransferase
MIRVSVFGSHSIPMRDDYIQRIKRLMPFEWNIITLKKCPDRRTSQLLPEEKKFLEKHKQFSLLDVSGKAYNSEGFEKWCFGKSERHLLIGPSIGFHSDFFARADGCLKLSDLTLTHGLAQLVLAESIYRAVCQRNNHPFVK